MKLSEWAKKNGLTYQTAWRLFNKGKLPIKATQLATGTILIDEEPNQRFCPTCGKKIDSIGKDS